MGVELSHRLSIKRKMERHTARHQQKKIVIQTRRSYSIETAISRVPYCLYLVLVPSTQNSAVVFLYTKYGVRDKWSADNSLISRPSILADTNTTRRLICRFSTRTKIFLESIHNKLPWRQILWQSFRTKHWTKSLTHQTGNYPWLVSFQDRLELPWYICHS